MSAGPFVAALFAKLENMLQNSLYVNVLLTGLVSQLACYPQPLLRSFLLSTNMVFQPSVKSLIQVVQPGGEAGWWGLGRGSTGHGGGCQCQNPCPALALRPSPSSDSSLPPPQVLGLVKNKIETFAASQEDFPSLLFKAKKYLVARGKLDWADTQNALPSLRRSETLGEQGLLGWGEETGR